MVPRQEKWGGQIVEGVPGLGVAFLGLGYVLFAACPVAEHPDGNIMLVFEMKLVVRYCAKTNVFYSQAGFFHDFAPRGGFKDSPNSR